MKRSHLLAHLSFPLLFALASLVLSLRRESPTLELVLTHVAWAFFFFSAPHFLWAAAAAVLRPALRVWHAGFLAASLALVVVGALSLWGPSDPSGLPYQWLVYWPSAGVLLLLLVVGWHFAGRPHAGA